jgi:hypothetical protein
MELYLAVDDIEEVWNKIKDQLKRIKVKELTENKGCGKFI